MVWFFFGFSGRIGRWPYFLGSMLLAIVEAFVLYRLIMNEGTPAEDTWALLFTGAWAGTLWPMIALTAKRMHDINQPGYYAVAVFIPVVSVIAFLALCFWPGDVGANRFGARTNAAEDRSAVR